MSKFIYMKFISLLTVIIGFSYSLTSIYNFFDTVLGNRIIVANANIYVMTIGLVAPLFVFIFGVFFYFYADICKDRKSHLVRFSIIVMVIIGSLKLIFSWNVLVSNIPLITNLLGFSHISMSYSVFILVILYIYGIIKYRY